MSVPDPRLHTAMQSAVQRILSTVADTASRTVDVLGMLAGGASHEVILTDFPYLEPDDIRASLAYAAASIGDTAVIAA